MSDYTTCVSVTTQKKKCRLSMNIISSQIMTATTFTADF
jgi:hypothetical protein